MKRGSMPVTLEFTGLTISPTNLNSWVDRMVNGLLKTQLQSSLDGNILYCWTVFSRRLCYKSASIIRCCFPQHWDLPAQESKKEIVAALCTLIPHHLSAKFCILSSESIFCWSKVLTSRRRKSSTRKYNKEHFMIVICLLWASSPSKFTGKQTIIVLIWVNYLDYQGEIELTLHNRGEGGYVWNIGDALVCLYVLPWPVIKVIWKLKPDLTRRLTTQTFQD